MTYNKAGEAIYAGVNFGDGPQNTFQANGAQQGLPGAVLFYPHIFDPGTGGQVTFSMAAVSVPANAGFTRVLYQDTNCNGVIDSGEPVITGALATVAGTNVCIVMKLSIPSGAPFNSTDATTITATFVYTNANPALNATYTLIDSTTVGAGTNAGLRLEKSMDKASPLPAP